MGSVSADTTRVSNMPSLSSLSTANSATPASSQFPVFDYLVCTQFDNQKGLTVSKQLPANVPLISNQLDNLLGLLMPLNLHKFLNRLHYTLIPAYIHPSTGLLSYTKDTSTFTPCYIYSLSYFQGDNSQERNGTARAISIVTRIPAVHVFQPLLYFLLQQLFTLPDDYALCESAFNNISSIPLSQLSNHFERLSPDARFVIARLEQASPVLPKDLAALFPALNGSLFKATVQLQGGIPFPIHIPASSLACSRYEFFGSDLQKDSNLRSFLKALSSAKLVLPQGFQETPMVPYRSVSAVHILLNAMLLRKKILFYCYESCYNSVLDYSGALLCLFDNVQADNYPFYPILDLGTLELIAADDHYLVGTSNLLFKDKLDWDVYYDIDANQVFVKTREPDVSVASEFFDTNDDRRVSVIGNGIKNLFRRSSVVDDTSSTKDYLSSAASITSDSSSINSICCPETLSSSMMALWEPAYYPKINKERVSKFLDAPKDSSSMQYGFRPQRIPLGRSDLTLGNCLPQIDTLFNEQLSRLISERHSDLTIFMAVTSYLRNLTTNILPAFYHYLNHLRLLDYRQFISNKLEDEDWLRSSQSSTSVFLEMRNYIKNEHIIQPFPLNFKYSPEMTFLDDTKQTSHYSKIVKYNRQLLKLAVKYCDTTFKVSSKDARSIPGFLFDWQGEDIRYDTHYIISILDKLIDDHAAVSWRLNGNFLLQFYKAINQILKNDKTNLPRLLADFFIDQQTPGSSDDSSDGDADFLARTYDLGLARFNKMVIISATYQVEKSTADPNAKKDLLLSEFKKVLSGILNNHFFKGHMINHLDDYMKLNVNDFIDFHM